jgi:acetyl-CoA acetyltransferase
LPFNNSVVSAYALTETSRGKVERGEKKLSVEEYIGQVFRRLLENANLDKKDIDGQGLALCGTVYPHSDIWTAEMAQYLGLRPRLLISSDHGGASGLNLLAQSMSAVEQGLVEFVICLGVDSPLSTPEFSLKSTGCIRDYENPSGIMGPNSMFGFVMQRHMFQYGTTEEQIGRVTVAERTNAVGNPTAYLKKKISIQDYLSSKPISDPIKLLDCCLPVNQGLGFLVSSRKRSQEITDKPISLIGFAEEDGYYHEDIMLSDITFTGILEASKRAFQQCKLSPSDMDFAQIYDDYAVAVLMQLEDLGFCEKGDGGKFLEKNEITFNGDLPVNTGGGQIASGQPGLAGGFVPLLEALIQLRNEGGARQVGGCTRGCVTGIGGLAYGRNLMLTSVGILSSEN